MFDRLGFCRANNCECGCSCEGSCNLEKYGNRYNMKLSFMIKDLAWSNSPYHNDIFSKVGLEDDIFDVLCTRIE